MPRLSPSRTLCAATVLLVAIFSLAPFTRPLNDSTFSARLIRGFELSAAAIGGRTDLALHVCAFIPIGVGAMGWSSRRRWRSVVLIGILGLYLFLGGRWIVDKSIPSNRRYCHECGYDLTHTDSNCCPECGTEFKAAT